MTDRYHSLTVILEHDIRDDDAQPLIEAIKMMKGVLGVVGEVSDSGNYVAEMRAKTELRKKLWELLYPET